MIVVFSGTTEGRRLSSRLAAEGAAVTVCVATGYGAAEQGAQIVEQHENSAEAFVTKRT